MRRSALILVLFVATSGACGSSAKSAERTTPTSAPSKVTAASTTTTTAGETYASKAFVVPFTVSVDAALESPPNPDSANLVSWNATGSQDDKVRFMVPVELYRPGSSTPEAPPKDYLEYLQGQTKDGAEITKATNITVGGYPAMLMNVTSIVDASHPDGSLDGSLGCPERGADRADGCFGPQPDLLLRMAVVKVGDTTLLTWARVNKAQPDEAFLAMFERMLTTVQFR